MMHCKIFSSFSVYVGMWKPSTNSRIEDSSFGIMGMPFFQRHQGQVCCKVYLPNDIRARNCEIAKIEQLLAELSPDNPSSVNLCFAGADVKKEGDTTGTIFRYPSYVQHIMGDIFSLGFGPFRSGKLYVLVSYISLPLHQNSLSHC